LGIPGKNEYASYAEQKLDLNNSEHQTAIKIAAEHQWGNKKPVMTKDEWLFRETTAPTTPPLPRSRDRSRTPPREGMNVHPCFHIKELEREGIFEKLLTGARRS